MRTRAIFELPRNESMKSSKSLSYTFTVLTSRSSAAQARWERGFVRVWLNQLPFLVQRPESILEEILWIVFLLDFDQTIPVVAEAGFGAFWGLQATEELFE